MTELDLSGCPSLLSLDCSGNNLTELTISGYDFLQYLYCFDNNLTTLDVSGCSALLELYCYNNQLTNLDVKDCSSLTYLNCTKNPIDSLNASGLSFLEALYFSNDSLIKLDVSGCSSLSRLDCAGKYHALDNKLIDKVYGKLSSLNVKGCTGLQYLDCRYNPLDSLDASGLTALQTLYVPNGEGRSSSHAIKILNVSGNTSLQNLNCYGYAIYDNPSHISYYGQLKKLNVSGCTYLQELECYWNRLEELEASGCTNLKSLWISLEAYPYASTLERLNIEGCTSLERLNCPDQSLSFLDVENCTSLKWLVCQNNQITTALNLNNCNSLQEIYCQNNQIPALTLDGCKNLVYVNCANNQITTDLNLNNCNSLQEIYCQNNQIPVLTLDGCKNLIHVNCADNQITSDFNFGDYRYLENLYCQNNQISVLDIKGCSILKNLNCSNNNGIEQLNLLSSSPLTSLSCSNNKITSLDLSGNPALKSVHCANNQIKDIDISQCLDLRCFYADSNALPLYEIYSVSQFYDEYLKPKDINLWHSSTEQHIKLKVKAGSLVDLHREMSFASSSTKVKVFNEADDTPLFEDVDYRITEGFLRFEQDGRYKIQLRNVNVPTNCDFENDYSPFIGTNSPVTVYYHVAYGDVEPLGTCEEPEFSLESGEVDKGTVVEISCATEGAQIRYTTDGSTPTEESPRYTRGITINKTTTIQAIAIKEDWENSKVATAIYTIAMDTCQMPKFSLEAGQVEKGTVVELSCATEGAQIHYTTNGSTPTEESPLYNYDEGITINKTTTIKAIAVKEDWENSKVAIAKYTVQGYPSGGDDDTLAITPFQPQIALNAYPNPCGDILYLETSQNDKVGEIQAFRLFDLQGREQICTPGSVRQIDMSRLPAGVYFLEATGKNGAVCRHKIIKR